MPNDKWDDDNIESLLRDFPAIKDERPKEEIYQRLKQSQQPQKKPKRWIPYLVAAIAFITFGVLLASMLGQNSSYDMSSSGGTEKNADSSSTAVEESAEGESESTETESSEAADSKGGAESFNAMENTARSAANSIYAGEHDDQTLFTVGLTENALVIPVSFIIANERLQEDFGSTEVGDAELYNMYAAEIDEEALGFDNYHPYSGTLEMTADGIEHTLPEGHNYDMASASISVYLNSLYATFKEAGEIAIVDETGKQAIFDQVGPIEPLEPPQKLAYYSYATENGETYLVPGFDMPHDNAAEALEAMKSAPNDLYETIILTELDYSVSETEEIITVEFSETVDFNSYEYEEAIRMIEGMALTADAFGKKLLFENIATATWDRFDFDKTLPVPAGINVKEFTN